MPKERKLLGGRRESPSLVSSSVSFQCMLASLVSIYLSVCHHDTKLWAWSNRLSDDPSRSSWNSLLVTSWVCEGYENLCQEALFFPLIHKTVPEAVEGFWHLHWKKRKGKKERIDPWGSWLQHFLKFLRVAFSPSMILQMMWTAASFSLFVRRRLNCEIYCAYACLRSLKILEFEG